ncbi:unnamed protein product [Orchesella dallaii]|uniref:FLYWCH-type domain-containing protein n=1 Tax=Orchesella dallaii TaxID=48710 RepID=A0ABP1S3L6_9HEXA
MKKGVKSVKFKFERRRVFFNNYTYARNSEIGQGSQKRIYWRCLKRTCKGRLLEFPLGTYTETDVEHICGFNSFEQAKDAALEKLKELTLSSESVKAIEIVRKVLKEMPPESRHLMPTEDSLRRRVTRWAQQAGIEVIRLTADDYVRNSESLALVTRRLRV